MRRRKITNNDKHAAIHIPISSRKQHRQRECERRRVTQNSGLSVFFLA